MSSISDQFFVIKDASHSLAAHANLCRAPRGLILWAGLPLVARPMYSPMGIGGYTPTSPHRSNIGLFFKCREGYFNDIETLLEPTYLKSGFRIQVSDLPPFTDKILDILT